MMKTNAFDEWWERNKDVAELDATTPSSINRHIRLISHLAFIAGEYVASMRQLERPDEMAPDKTEEA